MKIMTRKRRLSFASVLALATAVLLLTTAVVCVADVRNAYAGDATASAISVWDGTVDKSWFDNSQSEFTITTAAQLAGLAEWVNEGTTFEGKTIKLGADIDLNGKKDGATEWFSGDTLNTKHIWTPIGQYDASTVKYDFRGTFDGQGHTIYRMAAVTETQGAGFMVSCSWGYAYTLKNLTFDDCFAMSKFDGENCCGIVNGFSYRKDLIKLATIENVTVQNSVVRGNNVVGIFVGHYKDSVIRNCVARNNKVYANTSDTASYVGGFFGKVEYSGVAPIFENNKLINTTLVLPANKSNYGLWGGFLTNCTFTNCASDSTEAVTSDTDKLTNNGYVIIPSSLTIGSEDKLCDYIADAEGVLQYSTRSNNPSIEISFPSDVTVTSFKVNGVDATNYTISGKTLTISGLENKANGISVSVSVNSTTMQLRFATGLVDMPQIAGKVGGTLFDESCLAIKDGVYYFEESADAKTLEIGFATPLVDGAKAVVKYNGNTVTVTGDNFANVGNLVNGEYTVEYYFMDVLISTVTSDIKCLKPFGVNGLYYLDEDFYNVGKTHCNWVKVSASDEGNSLGYDYYKSSNAYNGNSASHLTLFAVNCVGVSWKYAASSEVNWDYLSIITNGDKVEYKSLDSGSDITNLAWVDGEASFKDKQFNIIEFVYSKDGSGDNGLDTAFLKDFSTLQGFDIPSDFTYKVSISNGVDNPIEKDIADGDTISVKYAGNSNVTFLLPVLNQGENLYVSQDGVRNAVVSEEAGYYMHTVQNVKTSHSLVFTYEKEGFSTVSCEFNLEAVIDGNMQDNVVIGENVVVNNEEYTSYPLFPMTFDSELSDANKVVYSTSNKGVINSLSGFSITVSAAGILRFDYIYNCDPLDYLYFSQGTKITRENCTTFTKLSEGDVYSDAFKSYELNITQAMLDENGGSVTLYYAYVKTDSRNLLKDRFAVANIRLSVGERTVKYSSSNADAGTVKLTKADGTAVASEAPVAMGETLTLSATENAGYIFYAWKNVTTGELVFDKRITFSLVDNCEYVAVMDKADKYAFRTESEYFENITAAMNSLTSGGKVFMIGDTTIGEDLTIPSGIELVLAYSLTDTTGYAQGGGNDRVSWNCGVDPYVTLTVNGKLTLNGKLIVGGVQHKADQSAQGHTSGAYAQMIVNGSVEIANGGYLDVIGRVTGNGTITAVNGATLRQPFTVNNYAGGTNTEALYNAKQFPFVQFATINVECKQIVNHGAKVIGSTSLYFWSSITTQDVVLVDKVENRTSEGEGALIWMHEGSSLEISYDSTRRIDAEVGNIHLGDFGVTTIDVYGKITAGEFSLQGYGSGEMVLAIPYTYNFNIKSGATVTIDQAYKIMPGAIVTIENGATVNITENGKLYVYDGLYQSSKDGKRYPYYDELEGYGFAKSGMLIVNGTLNINGVFAGIAQTVEGGEINVGANANVANQTIVEGCNDGYDYNMATFDMSGRVYGVNGFVNLEKGKTYRTFANNAFTLNSFTNKYWVGRKDSCSEQEFTLTRNQAMQGRFAEWNGQNFVLTLTFYIGTEQADVIVNVNGSDYKTDSNGKFTCSVEVANATDSIKYYTKNVYTAVKSQTLVLDQEMQTLTHVASGVALNNDNVYTRVYDKDGGLVQDFKLFATVSFYGTADTESVALSFDESALDSSVYVNNDVALTNSSLVNSLHARLNVVGSDVAQFIDDVNNLKNADDIVARANELYTTYGTLLKKGTGDDVAFITDYLNGYIGFASNIVKEIAISSATYGDGEVNVQITYINDSTATETATLSDWRMDASRIVATATLVCDYQGAKYNVTNTCDGSKKEVALNAFTADSAVYDGNMHAVTATLSGLANFDNDTLVYATATFGKDAGEYNVTFELAGEKAVFYTLTGNKTHTCTVSAKDITVTVNYAQAIKDKTETIVLVANASGNVDEITFTFAIYKGETLVATVGKDGKVTLADGQSLALGEYTVKAVTDNANYNIASQTAGTLKIVEANDYYNVDFNLGGTSKVYDGNVLAVNPIVKVKATGALVDASKYSVSVTGKGTQILEAGTYQIVVTLDGETIAQESFNVTAKDVTVTIKPQSSVYGEDINVDQTAYTASGVVGNDDLGITLAKADGRNAGKYDIVGAWNNHNYNVTFEGGKKAYEITAKAIVVEIENKESFYGEKDAVLSAKLKGSLAYTDSFDSLGIKLVRATGKNAGTYAISLDSWTNENYTITAENATYTVKKLALRAIVANATSVYGDTLAKLTFTIEGKFAEGESVDVLNAKLSIGNAKNAGTYAIEFAYDNANYDVNATKATYTITKREVTLRVLDATSVYGNPDAAFIVSITKGTMAEGEDAQSLVSITRAEGRNVGTYAITATKADNANYDVTLVYTGATNSVYTITKRPVTVTVKNADLPYTASWAELNSALSYESNVLAGDELNVRLFVLVGGVELTADNFGSMFAGGTHVISASIDNDNYELSVVNGTLTVGLPVVSLTNEASGITRVYGDTQNVFNWRTMLTGYLASATDSTFRAVFYSASDLTTPVDIATAGAGAYKMQIEIVHATAYAFADGNSKSELVDVTVEKKDLTESIVITLSGLTDGGYLVFSYGLSIDASVTDYDDVDILKVLTKDGESATEIDAVGAYEYTATIQSANYKGAKTLQFKVVNSAEGKIEDLKKYAEVEFLTRAQYAEAKALLDSVNEDDTLQINDDAEAKANYANVEALCANYAKVAANLDEIKVMLDAYAAGEDKKLIEAHDYIVALDEEKLALVKQSEEGKAYQEAWQAARAEGAEATEIANKVRDNVLFGVVAAVSALLAMAYVAFGKFRV